MGEGQIVVHFADLPIISVFQDGIETTFCIIRKSKL